MTATTDTPVRSDMVLHRALVTSGWYEAELVCFFEAQAPSNTSGAEYFTDVVDTVVSQLSLAWGVIDDDLRVTDVATEAELLASARGGSHTADARLFEVGHWHGPVYAEPQRTLLLVTPPVLERLVVAQRALPIVDVAAVLRSRPL